MSSKHLPVLPSIAPTLQKLNHCFTNPYVVISSIIMQLLMPLLVEVVIGLLDPKTMQNF